MATHHSVPPPTPLIDWAERQEIAALEVKRADLVKRMVGLRPNSHRRLELRGQVRLVTEQLLMAEAALERDKLK